MSEQLHTIRAGFFFSPLWKKKAILNKFCDEDDIYFFWFVSVSNFSGSRADVTHLGALVSLGLTCLKGLWKVFFFFFQSRFHRRTSEHAGIPGRDVSDGKAKHLSASVGE